MAAHDDSDGFWRRQILITVKDRDPARVDNPFLIEELSEERPGILLWMLVIGWASDCGSRRDEARENKNPYSAKQYPNSGSAADKKTE